MTEDFRFSSPRDDRIDKKQYFERCWPNAGRIASFDFEDVVESGDRVFVRYLARRADGGRFRNTEVFALRDGRIAEVEVYFGRDLDAPSEVSDERAIRALLDEKAAALARKDAARAAALYAPHARSFDLAPPLQTIASASARERGFEEWFATWRGPINVESRDLTIEVDGELATVHALLRLSGTKQSGGEQQLWFRNTTILRKTDGRWLIAHEHDSVPFDMTTLAASLDLQPQG